MSKEKVQYPSFESLWNQAMNLANNEGGLIDRIRELYDYMINAQCSVLEIARVLNVCAEIDSWIKDLSNDKISEDIVKNEVRKLTTKLAKHQHGTKEVLLPME
jgi:Zn-dependent M32 family carboxypeptidase